MENFNTWVKTVQQNNLSREHVRKVFNLCDIDYSNLVYFLWFEKGVKPAQALAETLFTNNSVAILNEYIKNL